MSLLTRIQGPLLKMEEGITKIGNSSSSPLRATEHSTLSSPYRPLEPHSRHCCASFVNSVPPSRQVLSFPSLIPPLRCSNATSFLFRMPPQSSPCSSPLPSELACLHHNTTLCSSRPGPLKAENVPLAPVTILVSNI